MNEELLKKLKEAQEVLDDQRIPEPRYLFMKGQWYKRECKKWTAIDDINEE